MATHLAFHDVYFNVINRNHCIYLTSVEIAQALKYKNSDAVTQIYERNSDEFSADMSETLNLKVSGNYEKSVRIFSLRGAHLIAMFARTPVAKEFRKWVLDILDKEAGNPAHKPEAPELLSNDDVSDLSRLICSMSRNFQFNQSWSNGIWYALRQATGIPSPQRFEVRQIPLIAQECRRIYQVTSRLQTLIAEAERQTVRRILRKKKDADTVLTEMAALLRQAETESHTALAATLERWQENNVNQFLQRH